MVEQLNNEAWEQWLTYRMVLLVIYGNGNRGHQLVAFERALAALRLLQKKELNICEVGIYQNNVPVVSLNL